jgi:hypothetical protein
LHFSKNAKNVIIAGAYFGDQAIPVANNIKDTGICHTFEPNKNNSDLIKENAKLNGLTNILINNLALWNKSNERLTFEGEDALASVEGSEIKVLQGAVEMLKQNKPVVVFETHSLYDDWSNGLENSSSAILMKGLGYEVFAVREFHQNIDTGDMPIELLPLNRTYCEIPPHHGFNMLAVPSKKLIENNLFRIVYDLQPNKINGGIHN